MSHLEQLGILLAIGSALCLVLWRWPDRHPVDCICERCRHAASDRYIDELLGDRERKDRQGRVITLDDYRWRKHG